MTDKLMRRVCDPLFNQTSHNWHMGVEENDEKPINLLEVQPEVTVEEPKEQVYSREPEDVRLV
jgi:hypothetical protein